MLVLYTKGLFLHIQGQGMADSSSTSSEAKNPNILDGKFFKVIAEEDKHVKAICQSCQKTISGSRSATSNFRTHLKVS